MKLAGRATYPSKIYATMRAGIQMGCHFLPTDVTKKVRFNIHNSYCYLLKHITKRVTDQQASKDECRIDLQYSQKEKKKKESLSKFYRNDDLSFKLYG
jgi:hypothetical protein